MYDYIILYTLLHVSPKFSYLQGDRRTSEYLWTWKCVIVE